jgi:hypothetical protein
VEVAASDTDQPKSVGPGPNSLAFAVREAWTVDLNGL